MAGSIRDRVRRAAGSQKTWAEATGQNVEHVSRIINGKYPVPEWWEAMLELLEALPPKDRPNRWG
ncbi:MAG TPA: hypothetical protein PLS35_18785 [Nitrospira sp.]|nr:hypothetical protein [Nitrospira sp.]